MNSEKVLSASISPKIPLILASGSLSRKQMLEEAGICFEVIKTDTDEDALKKELIGLPFEQQVIKLASAKAINVSINNPNHVVIGGDQMCVCNSHVFDKPGSVKKAVENLKLLSGTVHFQHSGVCLFKNGKSLWEYSEVVTMKMHNLSEEEIINYCLLYTSPSPRD